MKVHATDTRVSVSLGISTDAVIRAVYEYDQQEAALSSGDDPWANPETPDRTSPAHDPL